MWTSDAIVRSLERIARYPGWAYVVPRPHPAFRSSWRERPLSGRTSHGKPPGATAASLAATRREHGEVS